MNSVIKVELDKSSFISNTKRNLTSGIVDKILILNTGFIIKTLLTGDSGGVGQ